MNCKARVSILGLVLLAISFLISCGSSSSTTPPQTIAATGPGTTQATESGTPFASPLQATVTFTVQPVDGASATYANGAATETDATSSSGVVFSSTLTANITASSYTVVATTPATTTATYNLTNN
jgi:hypothetical protein